MSVVPARQAQGGARSILDAATELFANDGFEPVSIAQIAERAGVSKANVFHHFESKEALYLAVMRAASAVHADYAEALYDDPRPCADKLRALVTFEILNLIDNEHRTRLILREKGERQHRPACLMVDQIFGRNFAAVMRLFEQGVARGEFRRDLNVAAAALTLHGASVVFFQGRSVVCRFEQARTLAKPKVFAKHVGELLLHGVLISSAVYETGSAVRHGASAGHPIPRRSK